MGTPTFAVTNSANPAEYAAAITPSDTVDLTMQCRGIYVGVAGNVAVHGSDGVATTFVGLAAGSVLPFRAKRVLATGTTATSLVAMY